jgi:hypothetical protein
MHVLPAYTIMIKQWVFAETTILQVNLTCVYQDFLGTKLPSKNFRGHIAQTLTSHEAQYNP